MAGATWLPKGGMRAMLYLLTGEIQTGKTRWLESLTARLEAKAWFRR